MGYFIVGTYHQWRTGEGRVVWGSEPRHGPSY